MKKRRKSDRDLTDHIVFRPWILHLVLCARNRLRCAATTYNGGSGLQPYMEKHIPGIGKNVMTERDRAAGEAAYTSTLRRCALEVCPRYFLK